MVVPTNSVTSASSANAANLTTTANELEDFEAYLESDFNAVKFAGDILSISNGSENPELDLATPLKKLKYDLNELEKRMKSISSSNYDSLIKNFSEIEQYRKVTQDRINPALKQINKPFEKIKHEVIEPYEKAVKLNNALKKMCTTVLLLRSVGFFILIIQQLEEVQSMLLSLGRVQSDSGDVIKLSRLHNQLQSLYEELAKESGKDTSALSIKLVRDYRTTADTRRQILIQECSNTIGTELGKVTGLHIKNTKLYNSLQALYILTPKEFFIVFDKSSIQKQVTLSTGQLSKALQSPRNFTSILMETRESAMAYFDKLTDLLRNWKFHVHDDTVPITQIILMEFKVDAFSKIYWQRLAQQFKRNIVATMARGGPIAKNLKVYSQGLKGAVAEKITNELEKSLLLDALTMIDYQ